MAGDRPLLGVGPDNYRLVYGRYAGGRTVDPRVHSNNMYLEMLAGGGIAGAAAFAWLCWRGGRTVRAALGITRATPSEPLGFGLAAAAVAIALHGVLDSFWSFTATYVLIAMTFGLAAAWQHMSEAEVPDAHRI
jgi:O-antigen ligase